MKRNKRALILLLITIVFVISACGRTGGIKEIAKSSGIDLGRGKEISFEDTHGGFHGDGCIFAKIGFEDSSLTEDLKKNREWKKLPLSDNLNTFIYGGYDSKLEIPKIKEGYYYFKDRHSESEDVRDDSELMSRASFNFTLLIYDSETDIMYIIEYDT